MMGRRIAAATICALMCAPLASAIDLHSGDLVVAADNLSGLPSRIVRVSQTTGQEDLVATGGLLGPAGGAFGFDRDGTLLTGQFHSVVRVDPATGSQSVVSSGPALDVPFGVVVQANGAIVVGAQQMDGTNQLIAINRNTGAQTALVTIDGGGALTDLELDHDGNFLASLSDFSAFTSRIVRINPVTLAQTVVSSGNQLADVMGITVGSDGTIYAAAFRRIVAVNPVTGAQDAYATGGSLLQMPWDLAFSPSGDLFVADRVSGIYVAPPLADQVLISPLQSAYRLAFATVPTPGAAAPLCGVAVLAVARRRRSRGGSTSNGR